MLQIVKYLNEKFHSVQPHETPNISLIDKCYLKTIDELYRLTHTLKDGVPMNIQYELRAQLFQILVDDKTIFSTIKKLLETHDLSGRRDSQEDPDEDEEIDKRICHKVMGVLINGSDCNPEFGELLCAEPGLLEILVQFISEMKDVTKEDTGEVCMH